MQGLVEGLRNGLELLRRSREQRKSGLFIIGKRTHIAGLKRGQLGVLVVELGLGILQLFGHELRRVFGLLLVEVQILLDEHRGDFRTNLLGDPRLPERDVHIEAGQPRRLCALHGVQRCHCDRLLQPLD